MKEMAVMKGDFARFQLQIHILRFVDLFVRYRLIDTEKISLFFGFPVGNNPLPV